MERKKNSKPKKKNKVKCDACEKEFESVSAKNQHYKSKHLGRRFICSICGENQVSKFAYLRHMERSHSSVKPTDINEKEAFVSHKVEMTDAAKNALIERLKTEVEEKNTVIEEYKLKVLDLESKLKNKEKRTVRPEIGIKALNAWIKTDSEATSSLQEKLLQTKLLLSFTGEELNELLSLFLKRIRKPDKSEYAPDTLFYLLLAIQKYFHENGKYLNILYDQSCKGISDSLDEVLVKSLDNYSNQGAHGIIVRLEEDFLWECCHLGVHMPSVLLATLIYFNIKYFQMSLEDQKELKFGDIMVYSDNISLSLRFKDRVYERAIGVVPGFKCPVKHYEYYFWKCPEEAKLRNSQLFLAPILECNPSNEVWFSSQPMNENEMRQIYNRSTLIKEIIISASS